ncbi:helicase associated domain-containing protein [Streptomyces sp. NPDC127112]|uniref:helicase associated domain-containing protein n=1 Tax=Streptomyces sp. NPDC127112 TaxID=3345364 RepID=UPI00362D97F8
MGPAEHRAADPAQRARGHPGAGRTGPPGAREDESTTTTSGRGAEAFHKGVQALAQYIQREGGGVPGRAHVEHLPDGTTHRPGVWLANQRQRRDRLDTGQLEALAALGVEWATS